MIFTVAIGGARDTFPADLGDEVAGLIDQAFGSEGEWEGVPGQRFSAVEAECLTELRNRAVQALGADEIPHLFALFADEPSAFLPAHVQPMVFHLSQGAPLHCASLPGLRDEFEMLSKAWGVPLDDDGLNRLLEDSGERCAEEIRALSGFAKLAIAANEAVRRDCPLWLFHESLAPVG